MKKMMMVLMGLAFTLLISGCGGDGDNEGGVDNQTGTFTVINSATSTFRIVRVIANEINDTPSGQIVPGDGIHKGGQHSYRVEECDTSWVVDVIYNDQGSTRCEQVHIIPCGGNRDFIFNNTTC